MIPTAGGKSLVMACFIREVLEQWPDQRILIVTHVRELIAQNHAELLGLWPDAPAGIYSVGLGRRDLGVLFARLKLIESGPGRINFSKDRDAEYFRQLTSERVITRYERGRPIRSWHLKREGERNEVLDCTVYSRRHEEIRDLLGDAIIGWLISDGYGAYRDYEKRQGCVAHLIRKGLASSRHNSEGDRSVRDII